MVKLVHRDQPTVERLHTELIHGEAERGMGAHQHLVAAFEEGADRIDLAAVFARGIAEVPFRLNGPIRPEAVLA